jgi:hypothetical protein
MEKALDTIISQGGLLASLLVLSILALIALYKRNAECNNQLVSQQSEFTKAIKDMYDARLLSDQRVVAALERNNMLQADSTRVLEARTAVIDANTQALTKMSGNMDLAIAATRSSLDQITQTLQSLSRLIGGRGQ